MHPTVFRWLLNLYPPYWGTGIRVVRVSPDYRAVDVEMPLRFYNRNYVGTHFGGSLSAMVDPFYMLMLLQILGRDYIVWDRSSHIEFLRPGRGRVRAEFRITDSFLSEIRRRTENGDKFLPELTVEITGPDGEAVARATKTLYIRRKRR